VTTRISFVIPVRDDAAHLRRCLAAIRESAGPLAHEIVVVDHGSVDDSAGVARAAGATVLARAAGGRVAELRNAGAAAASAPLLAFIDADHEIDRGWVAAALALFESPDIAAAGAPYSAPEEATWVQRTYDGLRRHASGVRETEWLPSGNLIVHRTDFEALGGFDASLDTCEDVDFCQRLRRLGRRLVASDDLRSVHRGDPPTLKALFFGELWRGRDNLRVSLRDLRLASAPSLAIPLLHLLGIVAIALGIATWLAGGWRVAAAGLALVGTLVVLRSAALLSRRGVGSARAALEVVLVSAVYDAARALALLAPFGHALRRKS
jgi:glycosyltransferase involved in cell wall biosynthesis